MSFISPSNLNTFLCMVSSLLSLSSFCHLLALVCSKSLLIVVVGNEVTWAIKKKFKTIQNNMNYVFRLYELYEYFYESLKITCFLFLNNL